MGSDGHAATHRVERTGDRWSRCKASFGWRAEPSKTGSIRRGCGSKSETVLSRNGSRATVLEQVSLASVSRYAVPSRRHVLQLSPICLRNLAPLRSSTSPRLFVCSIFPPSADQSSLPPDHGAVTAADSYHLGVFSPLRFSPIVPPSPKNLPSTVGPQEC